MQYKLHFLMLSPIYIDPRIGSGSNTITRTIHKDTPQERKISKSYKGLYEYPPLNSCIECQSSCHQSSSLDMWCCLSNPLHSTLCEISTLDSADAYFLGNNVSNNVSNNLDPTSSSPSSLSPLSIGIEVKSLSDLLSSLQSGRLFDEQIPKMIHTYDVRYLIFYTPYRPSPSDFHLQSAVLSNKNGDISYWHTEEINGRPLPFFYLTSRLTTLMNCGINIIPVSTISDVCVWIYNLHRWHNKSYEDHLDHIFPNPRILEAQVLGKDDLFRKKLSIAYRLPSIDRKRAVHVASHFRSIYHMMTANDKEWQTIEGIGKGIAKNIHEFIYEGERKEDGK